MTHYTFTLDKVSFSAVEQKASAEEKKSKKFYVTGYISTQDMDLYNDIVTEEGMKSMLEQIQKGNITLDYEHEAWRDDNTILPVGKIVEARIDANGLWVKAELNKHSPKFKNLWGSVKDGFINAFSIAFKPLKAVTKLLNDVEVRLIDDLELLNVALTSTPVNPEAKMTGYNMKSVMQKALADMETEKMAEEEQPKQEVQEEAKTEEVQETKQEETKEEPKQEEAKEEPKQESVEEKSQYKELVKELKSLKKDRDDLKAEVKSMKETMVFKSKVENKPEEKSEEVEDDRSVLSMI